MHIVVDRTVVMKGAVCAQKGVYMQLRVTLEILGTLSFVFLLLYGVSDLLVNVFKSRRLSANGKGMLVSVRTLIFGALTVLFFVAALLATWLTGGG